MSRLLDAPPYSSRDDETFLAEMNALTRHHRAGCPPFARIWPGGDASRPEDLPFLHVGLFKQIALRTEGEGISHEREVLSSATTGTSSRVALDQRSSEFQSRSTTTILADFLGNEPRPLLIVDSAKSLRRRGEMSARVAAAMSLKPLASDMFFLLAEPDDPRSMKWDLIEEAAKAAERLIVYGFSWILWLAWGAAQIPPSTGKALEGKQIHFVHSGGWKKLEDAKVDRARFDEMLIASAGPSSKVVDYYGLVEQIGVIYPLCEHGLRHVPRWAHALVRDPLTLDCLLGEPGMLQLMNCLAWGAPYHSVLTEDLAVISPDPCPCGRSGPAFELLGRIPRAELRGCANV